MQIYWIENQKRCGPASVPDILSKLELGELSRNTLTWHSGCSGWVPLEKLPALQEYMNHTSSAGAQPSLPPRRDTVHVPKTASPAEDKASIPAVPIESLLVGFGPRLVARLMDCALYTTALLGIMYLLRVPYQPYFQPGNPLFWLPFVLLEGISLRWMHTTPGKFWMGIGMAPLGNNSGLGVCTLRSLLVFIIGMGCMLPLLAPITAILTYIGIRRNKITYWDMRTAIVPVCPKRVISPFRIISTIFLLYVCLQLSSFAMQPWIPDMINEIHSQNPDAASWLQSLLNPY